LKRLGNERDVRFAMHSFDLGGRPADVVVNAKLAADRDWSAWLEENRAR